MKRLENKDRINVFYILEDLAKDPECADRVFLKVPKDDNAPNRQTEWTYSEAYDNVLKYAAWLKQKHEVQKDELIAMDFTNKPQFVWVWFALWSLGAIPAFINHNLRDKAFVHSVRVSTSRLLLVDPEIREVLSEETMRGLSAGKEGHAVETIIVEPETEAEIMSLVPYRAPDEARSGATTISTSML